MRRRAENIIKGEHRKEFQVTGHVSLVNLGNRLMSVILPLFFIIDMFHTVFRVYYTQHIVLSKM